ncbi:MAG: P1 family peptidase [Syntrophobacterales bacterium]|nr:P1 family peptidase [Syntrophobacterales bacterium]
MKAVDGTNDTITAILGIRVGHAHLRDERPSGCTVVLLPPEGAPAGVDIRGGAPGTCGTDSLSPINLVDRVHGIFFSGGSAFGLSVGDGVRRFLSSYGLGFETGYGKVPIVAGAIIFDLGVNRSGVYPDAQLGFEACIKATDSPCQEGNVGAGLGATVGKLYGVAQGMKGGLGSFCIKTGYGLMVGALMVVNAFGDIWDPWEGRFIAGCRKSSDSLELAYADRVLREIPRLRGFPQGQNTVIGLVATNARLNKNQLTKVAQMAHDGLARTIVPAHTQYDGDTIFSVSCGELDGVETSVIGALAAEAVAHAIIRAVKKAKGFPGIPSYSDIMR